MLDPSIAADLKLAQNGDRQAMERLLAALLPLLESLARRYAEPGSPQESCADLVQEASMRIWQKLPQFQGSEDMAQTAAMFHDWVSQLVRRLAQDRQRHRHAHRRKPKQGIARFRAATAGDSNSDAGARDPSARGPTPSTNVRRGEEADRIRAALAKIADDTDREIVRLCFFDGLSLRQIAERLNVNYDKVRTRYHACLRQLERELKGLI